MHVYNYISFLKTSFKKFFNLKPFKQVLKAKSFNKSPPADKTWALKKIRDQAFLVFFKGLTFKSDYSKFLKKNEVI
ncbi:hypothetical protein C2R45_03465 [Helicobacter pylori]|nr:hypothetical protein C2R45_03465 [Helicobacter pylori]